MDENMITTRKSLGLTGDKERLTIVEGVLHLIYRKTLLLLVPEDNNRHWIVPHNLRELCNFIYFLQGMDDVAFKKNGDEYQLCTDDDFDPGKDSREEANKRLETLESNLRRLMQYIVSDLLDYSTSNMSDDTRGMAEVLVKLIRDLPDWTLITMNKKIVREILRYASQDNSVYKEFYSEQQRKALLNAARHNFIVSMGDVQYVLGVLSRRSNDYIIKKLTEYIRVIWSIKMTMEFYCVGVKFNHNEDKKELYEENAGDPDEGYNYITTHFRDTVGGMMFNPDGDTQFIKFDSQVDGVTINKNWIILNYSRDNYAFENLAKQKLSDEEKADVESAYKTLVETQQTNCKVLGCITVFTAKDGIYVYDRSKGWINNAVEEACKWRTLSSGQYYRENNSLAGVKTIYLNYFSLFTNLLSPNLIDFDAETNGFCDWQKNNIIAFPFYSMDWMNSFFIELKKACRDESKTDNIEQAIGNLNDKIVSTIDKMAKVTQTYVKNDPMKKLIGNDFKTRFEAIVYAKDCNDPNRYDKTKKSEMLNKITTSLSGIFDITPPEKTPQEK